MKLGQSVNATPNGVAVRKVDGSYLAEVGELVICNSYWLRRQSQGDVTLTEPVVKSEDVLQPVAAPMPAKSVKVEG